MTETTQAHPFLVLLRGWVDAKDLRPGMAVRRADGSSGAVEQVVVEYRAQALDHLTVADAHTFVVGNEGWVVHNGCGGDSPERFQNRHGGQNFKKNCADSCIGVAELWNRLRNVLRLPMG